jgi:hypothetical protein
MTDANPADLASSHAHQSPERSVFIEVGSTPSNCTTVALMQQMAVL